MLVYPDYKNGRKSFPVNVEYEELKLNIREKLSSEEGVQFYGKRKIDVEPTFGQVKANFEVHSFFSSRKIECRK